MEIREFLGFGPSKVVAENRMLSEEVTSTKSGAMEYVRESMMVALSVALEDRGWLRTDNFERAGGAHLTFKAIQAAGLHGRALVQGNPIMQRAALAKTSYVWGNGVRIEGCDNLISRPKNKRAIFSEAARQQLQFSKIADGNVLILITGEDAKLIPFYEITGAIYDPTDSSEIWYFHRVWTEVITDFATNMSTTMTHTMLYPNMSFDNGGTQHPTNILGVDVYTEGVIRHVAPNRLVGGAWGLPDLLAGIFYAGEHKELIEAADSIFRAQSQYAVQYKTKTRRALENVAASIAAPPPLDPRTGEPAEYGQSIAFGQDIEMQLMGKIGGGIDFNHFDPIAALASVVLGVPLDVVLGKEDATESTLPFSTLQAMKMEQRFWDDVLVDVLEQMGKKRKKIKTFWPKINPDPTHRQVQSIVGAAATKVIGPDETRGLLRDTFGADWDEAIPDPKLWEPFAAAAPLGATAPGSTEPKGTVTPGQGQTGQMGKLANGDHSLRAEGGQAHAPGGKPTKK